MRPRCTVAAALLVSAAVLGVPGAGSTQTSPSAPDLQAAARAQFEAGRQFYLRRQHREALAAFRSSLLGLDSPNTRLFLARCLQETGQVVDARREFQRAEDDAAARAEHEVRYAPTRDAALTEGAALEPGLLRLDLLFDPGAAAGATVFLNGAMTPTADLSRPQWFAAGDVQVEIRWRDGGVFRERVRGAAGERRSLRIPDARRAARVVQPVPVQGGATADAGVAPAAPGGVIDDERPWDRERRGAGR